MAFIGNNLGSITTEARTVDTMVGDGSTATLTLTKTPGSVNNVEVFYDGIFQTPGEDFTLAGSTLTFTTAPTTGINVVAISGDDSQVVFPDANSITTKKILDNTITSDKFVDIAVEKLSGTLPALDGTAVTGMNLPDVVDVTTAASDPTRTTNKPVGSLFVNSTSGEMFICTDAETDNNTWMNVGLGNANVAYVPPPTGYQGTQSGYSSGSYNFAQADNIEKYSFASAGTAVITGSLTATRGIMGGCSSTTYGHQAGGRVNQSIGPYGNGFYYTIDKFAFASSGDAVGWGDLVNGVHMGYNSSCTDWDVAGYVIGGYSTMSLANSVNNSTNMIQKYSFSSSAGAVDTGGNILGYWNGTSGLTDRVNSYGYCAGGKDPALGHGSDDISRFSFNSGASATFVGDLTGLYRIYANGCNSATHGFTVGGGGPDSQTPGKIQKFAFSSSTAASNHGDIGVAVSGGGEHSVSDPSNGFFGGESNCPIQKFSFASQGNSVTVGSLSEPAGYNCGNQV